MACMRRERTATRRRARGKCLRQRRRIPDEMIYFWGLAIWCRCDFVCFVGASVSRAEDVGTASRWPMNDYDDARVDSHSEPCDLIVCEQSLIEAPN